MAKTSQAQNGGQTSPPALPALKPDASSKVETKGAPLPPPPIAPVETRSPDLPSTPSPTSAPPPPVSAEPSLALPEPKHDEALAPPPIEPESPAQVRTQAPEPVIRRIPSAEVSPVAATEDPELSAQSFVERNQKEAEERLKALTTEAEHLRTRLNKLESGIKKWENLVNALKTAQQGPVTSTAVTSGAEDAGDLEPIRPGMPGGARGEKRVKWSNAAGSGNTVAGSTAGVQPPAEPTEPAAEPQPVQAPAARPAQAAAPSGVPR